MSCLCERWKCECGGEDGWWTSEPPLMLMGGPPVSPVSRWSRPPPQQWEGCGARPQHWEVRAELGCIPQHGTFLVLQSGTVSQTVSDFSVLRWYKNSYLYSPFFFCFWSETIFLVSKFLFWIFLICKSWGKIQFLVGELILKVLRLCLPVEKTA